MSKEKRNSLLEKLKKLFALGKSSNQHEAELAMQKANDIMQEYQISATDVDLHDIGEYRIEGYIVEGTNGARHWIYILANAAAKLFDGRAARITQAPGKMKLAFLGTETDIVAMRMTFEHLWKSWQSIYASDWAGIKAEAVKANYEMPKGSESRSETMHFKQGHGTGFADAIDKRVDELVAARQGSVGMTATGRDLIVVKNKGLEDFAAGKLTQAEIVTSNGSAAGQLLGTAAGNRIPLNAVETTKQRRISHG